MKNKTNKKERTNAPPKHQTHTCPYKHRREVLLTAYFVVVISEMKFTSGLVVVGCALVLFRKWQVKSWLNFGYIYVWYIARWRSRGSRWKAWSWFWHGNGWSQGCGRVNKVPLPHSLPPSLPTYDVFFILVCFFFILILILFCPSSFHFFVIGGATF